MPSMLRSKVVISELAFDVLMELEVKQDRPAILAGTSPGTTWVERRQYVEQVIAELQQRGLAEDDEVHPDLLTALNIVARPLQEFHGVHSSEGQPVSRIMAATQGDGGVFACLRDGQLSLEPVRAHTMADPLVGVLPQLPPIHGQPLRVPVAAVRSETVYAGRSGTETDDVKQLLSIPQQGAGQFSMALRDRTGRWHRSEFPISYFDTAQGRYLTQEYRPTSNGGPWLVVTPADSRTVALQVNHALTALRQAAARTS